MCFLLRALFVDAPLVDAGAEAELFARAPLVDAGVAELFGADVGAVLELVAGLVLSRLGPSSFAGRNEKALSSA